ncbi:MAG: alpha/beta hydrolase, partial [SAR202 cluster bacterium]|nr:alpha/beta hydrolase [SAR202 cluster bacterium]
TNSRPERESDHMDLKPVLQNIAVPILLIIGGSRTSEFEEAFSLAEKVTNIETVVISDTGHNMYMERPQAVAEVARKFLQSDKVPKII